MKKDNQKWLEVLSIIVLLLALAIYFIWFVFVEGQRLSGDSSDWGVFGDYLNPFITFATLLWIIRTVTIQQKELKAAMETLNSSYLEQERSSRLQSEAARINAIATRVNAIQSDINGRENEKSLLIERLHKYRKPDGVMEEEERHTLNYKIQTIEEIIDELINRRESALEELPDLKERPEDRIRRIIERNGVTNLETL